MTAKNIRDGKLSNVAITIDKVRHVLKQMGTQEPPIRKLTSKEVFERLWASKDSFKESLDKILDKIEDGTSEVAEAREFLEVIGTGEQEPGQSEE